MNTLSISNWIVNAFGERCDVRDAICFVPICRLFHLKPSGNRICPRMNLSGAFRDLKGELSIRPIWHQLETCPRENGEENRSSYPHFHEDKFLFPFWLIVST